MTSRLNITILYIFIMSSGFCQKPKIGYLTVYQDKTYNTESLAAWKFLEENDNFVAKQIDINKSLKPKSLKEFDVLWFHFADTTKNIFKILTKSQLSALKSFVENGGSLLLTREAFQLIVTLGLEQKIPDFEYKKAEDSGYGRMLGFHSYRSHPVFEGLNGGAYVLKPSADLTVRNFGYFGENIPAKGKVVATDWDYIFLRENKKMILEFEAGKGKVLAVGSYIYFEFPGNTKAKPGETYNVNKLHLAKFTENCLNYLSRKTNGDEKFYWNYKPFIINRFKSDTLPWFPSMKATTPSKKWRQTDSPLMLKNAQGDENFWDVAGERILLMGKEKGGIDEIWAHPFMAFRDMETGIRLAAKDSIWWLKNLTPQIEVRPESFTRIYRIGGAMLKEIIVASPDKPQAIIHYEFSGMGKAEMFIRFKTNQRLMWPYSEVVTGGIFYDFHKKLNAYIFSDPTGDFISMIGFNKPTVPISAITSPLLPATQRIENAVGCHDQFFPVDTVWQTKEAKDQVVAGLSRFFLEPEDFLDVIVAASSEGPGSTMSAYDVAAKNPEKIFANAQTYHQNIQNQFLTITTPDSVFNQGYAWALEATDRFFTTTPGIGSSLVAGIGATDQGWDGGHKVNGRPGYAWYFGRDAAWSCFALLNYGDFEKVKANLKVFQNFQDLNGKIFHELSTSGFVHYDASDATPLYVALAGKYLKHSGDVEFIRQSWPNIKAALDFMYTTDTDNDGLIENTNVGHGWVEGGGLFGSHTSLYLASCWCEALSEAATIAETLGMPDVAEKYKNDSNKVKDIINTKFRNADDDFYYHGLKKDGTFIEEKSMMPAIPVLFGQIQKNDLKKVTERFAGNEFSSDWGVRIVGESSPMFKPNGYHSGSVWPLFTGWTSLAEYKAGRSLQGFTHLMNNLLIYQHWGLGFTEEVLNGAEYKPSGVCHHQCWSQTMILQPAIEGMLGLKPDAVNKYLDFSPSVPFFWDSFIAENINVGGQLLNFRLQKKDNNINYGFYLKQGEALKMSFHPVLPEDCRLLSVKINGELVGNHGNQLSFDFLLENETFIEVDFENGTQILPVVSTPQPGDHSAGFRILDSKFDGNCYEILLEGKSGQHHEFEIMIHDRKPVKTENADLLSVNESYYKFSVDFPLVDKKYSTKNVKVFF